MFIIVKCSNCLHEIVDEEYVRCVNTGVPLHIDCANHCMECGAVLSDAEFIANKFKCNTCNKPLEVQIDSIRRSYIEDYKECPYKFKLLAIDKYEGDNNPYAMNGIILHDLFEKASNKEGYDEEDMKKEYLDLYATVDGFNDQQIAKDLPTTLYKKGLVCIENFYEYHLNTVAPFATEEMIQYQIREDYPKIQITFDRINKDEDGGLHLVDYKTGRTHVGKKLSNDLQIATYIMAVKEKYGVLPESFTLLFLAEDKARVYLKEDDNTYVCTVGKRRYIQDLNAKMKEVLKIFDNIKKGRFDIPITTLSPWYCENRCPMYQKYCEGVIKEPWKEAYGG